MLEYQCKVEKLGNIQRELTISIEPKVLQDFVTKRLAQVQKRAELKGFRKGKAPLSLIRQHFLQDVHSDVFSEVIRESYLQAIEENKMIPVGDPQIQPQTKDFQPEEKLTYTAKIEVFPEFEIQDLQKIKLTRQTTEVTPTDVQDRLKKIQESYTQILPDEEAIGPAKLGDLIEVHFQGTVDGQTMDSLNAKNRLIELGAKQFMEEFEAGIMGMKKGETKTFPVSFSADFAEPMLAGKTAQFTVELLSFKKKELPPMNDEFAKDMGLNSLEELQKKIEDVLKQEKEEAVREKLKEDALDQLAKLHVFDLPRAMVLNQFDHLIKENVQFLKRSGFTQKMIEDYLEKNKESLHERALMQVRVALVLDKIASQQKINIEEADLMHEYHRMSERFNTSVEQVQKMMESDPNRLREIRFRLREERAIDYLLSQAQQ